jgi:tRNA threonylcarbamoyladenosine biosynthesis protein TsaB
MRVLTIRTDKPEAEIGLFDGQEKLYYHVWEAHRQLAETIHRQIKDLLNANNQELHDLGGIVVFKGPGSFTGLRIGLSVANAFADSLAIPIAASIGETWIARGIERLQNGENDEIALPEYGASARTTRPKH